MESKFFDFCERYLNEFFVQYDIENGNLIFNVSTFGKDSKTTCDFTYDSSLELSILERINELLR